MVGRNSAKVFGTSGENYFLDRVWGWRASMRRVHRLTVVIVATCLAHALVLSGCATGVRPLAIEEMARIQAAPKITAVVYQPTPAFRQRGAYDENWNVLFGPIGVFATESRARAAGETTRIRVGLEDPVFVLRDRFVAGFNAELGIAHAPEQQIIGTDGIDELVQKLGSSGVVLDFKTIDWGIGSAWLPFKGDLGYGIFYMARARVIRLDDRKVLWQSLCFGGTPDDKRTTASAFLENDAVLLKQGLVEAAESCAKGLLCQITGRTAKPA